MTKTEPIWPEYDKDKAVEQGQVVWFDSDKAYNEYVRDQRAMAERSIARYKHNE